ncbi:hypothetical protein B484DRAFT_17119 [Ochromonadaceae sp. CCMP2298]|nr:hypothetical protein B484DRAFT_17119 [Ochromonadaceae sp. CCMP2298]
MAPPSQVGQLYTYFVRRHLNRVAARCQEEAQDFSLRRTAPAAVLADANNAYRRLVYADALSAVHPSRFYYTVPLCQTCYKIYTCMDAQREVIVLHSPHSHAVSTAAAVAAAEHVRYSPEERQRLLWRREHKSGGGSAGGVGGQTRSPPQPRIEQAEEPVQVQEQAQARGGAGFVDHFPPQPSSPTTSPPPTSPPEEAPPTSVDYSPPQEHRSGSGGSGGGVYASHLRQRVQQSGAQTGERGTGAVEAGTGAGADANGEGLGMYTDGDADVSPESQRRDVWRSRVRSEEPPPARGGTITAWIKLLQDKNANEQGAGAIGGGGASAKGAGAAYHQQLGLQTAAEWDHQGRAPHLQQTSSSRRNSKTLERPGSSDFRRPSSAGATGLRESRSRERSSERSSERSRERGRERGKERSAERGEEKSARVARAPSRSRFRSPPGGAGALGSSGAKRRPHSAGAVPSPATRAMQLQRELQEVQGQAQQLLEFRHGQEDLSDEGIAQLLEQEAAEVAFLAEPSPREVAMAHKMLRLSAQLSARALSPTKCRDRDGRDGRGGWDSRDGTDSRDNRGRSGGAGDAGAGAGAGVGAGDPPTAYQLDHEPAPASTGAETEVDRYLVEVRAAYAYSSLPFMAAPYHPAHKDMPGAPAIAELTQLRIDPQGKRLVQPRPLPAALPPSPQRASKPGKPAPATSFTPVHFRQLRQEWQELLEQRQEQPEHAQTHAQAHMEPMHAQGQAQGETQPQAQKKAQAVEGGEGLLLTQSQGSPAHRQGVGSRAGEGEGEWGYDMAASRLRESTDSRPMSPPVFRNPSPPQRPPPHLTVSLLDPQQQPDTTLHLPLRATHQQQPEKSQQQREVAEVAEEEIRAGGHLGHNLEAPGAVEGEVWESPSSTTPMYLSQTLSASSLPTRTHSTPHSLSPSPLAYPSPSLPHSPVSRDYALSSALSPLLPHSPSPRTQAQKAKAALADGDGGMDGDGDGGTPSSLQHMGISLEQSGDSLTSALTPGAFSAPSTPLTPNAQAQAQHGSSAFARTPASAPVGAPSPYFGSPDSLAPMGLTLDLSPSHLSPSHLLSPDALGSFGGLGSSLSLSPFADMSLSIVAQDSRASP